MGNTLIVLLFLVNLHMMVAVSESYSIFKKLVDTSDKEKYCLIKEKISATKTNLAGIFFVRESGRGVKQSLKPYS